MPDITIQSNVSQQQEENKTTSEEHPPLFDEYDDFVHKCQKDAIRNSEKIVEVQTNSIQIKKNGGKSHKTWINLEVK